MKSLIYIAILIVIHGCTPSDYDDRSELYSYRCTEQQFNLVTMEYEQCLKAGYYDNYCFLSAKRVYCEYIGTTHINQKGAGDE